MGLTDQIIATEGLTPWPKLFHNMRISRQTELAATFPIHVVCEWLGNSRMITQEHYLRVTDADFKRATGGEFAPPEKALQKAVQSAAASPRQPAPADTFRKENTLVSEQKVVATGLEPVAFCV